VPASGRTPQTAMHVHERVCQIMSTPVLVAGRSSTRCRMHRAGPKGDTFMICCAHTHPIVLFDVSYDEDLYGMPISDFMQRDLAIRSRCSSGKPPMPTILCICGPCGCGKT
jgi:hypothetical protein